MGQPVHIGPATVEHGRQICVSDAQPTTADIDIEVRWAKWETRLVAVDGSTRHFDRQVRIPNQFSQVGQGQIQPFFKLHGQRPTLGCIFVFGLRLAGMADMAIDVINDQQQENGDNRVIEGTNGVADGLILIAKRGPGQ